MESKLELTVDDYNVYKNAVKEIVNEKSTSILKNAINDLHGHLMQMDSSVR